MRFRQLLPRPAEIDELELLGALRLGEHAPDDRPTVAVNFVLSADGHASVDGRSAPLGGESDRAMFHGLREQFDAVLAGTGTLATERYGRILGSPERRERRRQSGRSAEPLACIISRSGQIPSDIPLFDEPEARVAVFTGASARQGRWQAQVEQVELSPGEDMIPAALRLLRRRWEVRSLLCEGGPAMFGAMLRAGVVDELFLTLSPRLVGGGEGGASQGPELPDPAPLQPLWLLERGGFLYLRYGRG